MVALNTDCVDGNKKAMMESIKEIENSMVDDHLKLVTLIPDSPYIGKSVKASFINWFLALNNERTNLSFLFTLRNRLDKGTMKQMQTVLPKNDYVKSKDMQDYLGVFCLTTEPLTNYFDDVGHVVHTMIAKKSRFTNKNKVGQYPHPLIFHVYRTFDAFSLHEK